MESLKGGRYKESTDGSVRCGSLCMLDAGRCVDLFGSCCKLRSNVEGYACFLLSSSLFGFDLLHYMTHLLVSFPSICSLIVGCLDSFAGMFGEY